MSARRLPHEQRREVIIDAAELLFAERGYISTRLEDVAARSDVSKQLLLRHFASKQDLLLAAVIRHRDGLLATLSVPLKATDLESRFQQRTDVWFNYLEDHPHASRLLFADITGVPEIAAFYAEMRDAARRAVADMLRADGTLSIPEPLLEPVSEMVRSGTVGLALWWSTHRDIPRDVIVALALEVWKGGLWHSGRNELDDRFE